MLMPYFASGLLLVLSSPPAGLWPLVFVALVPLLIALETEYRRSQLTYRNSFVKCYITGLIYALGLFFWLAHINAWAIIPVVAGFACLHGLFGLGMYLGLTRGLSGAGLSLWTACVWISVELLGSDWFVTLPSYAIGYLLWESPFLIQVADITGVFGVSLWVIAVNILIARLWQDGLAKNKVWLSGVMGLTVIVIVYGSTQFDEDREIATNDSTLTVSALHSSVKAEEKRNPALKKELFESFKDLTNESLQRNNRRPDLIVWPETSIPVWLRSIREREVVESLLHIAEEAKSPILLGARSVTIGQTNDPNLYNAAFLVPERGYISQEYRKMLLAPGVETTPFFGLLPKALKQRWPPKMQPGGKPGLMDIGQNSRVGIFICWEVFFPDFVRNLASKGAGFLVNISNDEAAFGEIAAAYPIPVPHIVYRAVENRRFIVRSANWGSSMFVSPTGMIVKSSQEGTAGILTDSVAKNDDVTFFSRHGYIVAKLIFLITTIWLVFLLMTRPRQSIQRSTSVDE